MLTAAVVIWFFSTRMQLITQERCPQSNLTPSTACGFAALTAGFWHSRAASASGVTFWALAGAEAVVMGLQGLLAADRPQPIYSGKIQTFQLLREGPPRTGDKHRSEEHTSELQSHVNLVCRLLL